ncbi:MULTISPECIES: sulfurtransferase [unclassified Vibrio]|uniref:sulfurtransferase n=1 Tax=unclassified Vibrio TaxID=2614977 RepID=UPI003075D2C9
MSTNLVTTEWLEKNLNRKDLVILDATMDSISGDNSDLYNRVFIPKTQRFDIKHEFSKIDSELPCTVPTYDEFCQKVRKLGIKKDSTVVIYDAKGIYSSPRAWWLLTLMGHKKVFVLDGGMPKWEMENRPLAVSASESNSNVQWEGDFFSELAVDKDQISSAIALSEANILDARSFLRFSGAAPEPRKGLSSGHVPSAKNLPFEQLVSRGCYLPKEALKAKFDELGIDMSLPSYFYCGSGVTACILLLAALEIGMKQLAIYDGSWSEWGADPALLIEAGNVG